MKGNIAHRYIGWLTIFFLNFDDVGFDRRIAPCVKMIDQGAINEAVIAFQAVDVGLYMPLWR
jgi:hypothetical protein